MLARVLDHAKRHRHPGTRHDDDQRGHGPQFCGDERASFTLTDNGTPVTSIPVPAPTVVVDATGCTDCGAGAVVGFTAHMTNGGPAIAVELKTGIRLPDGSARTPRARPRHQLDAQQRAGDRSLTAAGLNHDLATLPSHH